MARRGIEAQWKDRLAPVRVAEHPNMDSKELASGQTGQAREQGREPHRVAHDPPRRLGARRKAWTCTDAERHHGAICAESPSSARSVRAPACRAASRLHPPGGERKKVILFHIRESP